MIFDGGIRPPLVSHSKAAPTPSHLGLDGDNGTKKGGVMIGRKKEVGGEEKEKNTSRLEKCIHCEQLAVEGG